LWVSLGSVEVFRVVRGRWEPLLGDMVKYILRNTQAEQLSKPR
jgi:hypothetical protein